MGCNKQIYIDNLDNLFLSLRAPEEFRRRLSEDLSFTETVFNKGGQPTFKKYTLLRKGRGDSYLCLSGFLEKIIGMARVGEYELHFSNGPERVMVGDKKPAIKGKVFKEHQTHLIQKALRHQRGVVLSPTGTGKTVCIAGFLSCFPLLKCVVVCPSISLIYQTYSALDEMGIEGLGRLGGPDKKIVPSTRVLITTRQSFSTRCTSSWFKDVKVLVVDECHIGFSGYKTQFFRSLSEIDQCFIRIGFTATLPNTARHKLFLEGLLGPVVGKVDYAEAERLSLIKTPEVRMLGVPFYKDDYTGYSFTTIYEKCISNNKERNGVIIEETQKWHTQGRTILIFVSRVKHGETLSDFLTKRGIDHLYIRGSTKAEIREEARNLLNSKEVRCIIASVVWKEGVNIPALDTIIMAGGGKSSTAVLQQIGRALRVSDGKSKPLIIDFDDNQHILRRHSKVRKGLYKRQNWLVVDKSFQESLV